MNVLDLAKIEQLVERKEIKISICNKRKRMGMVPPEEMKTAN